jgi:3-oxoacyl-[acyl-carrier protein] reductase
MGSWMDARPDIRPAIAATTALGRIGESSDVADVVAFLASPDARWITGVTIEASGGAWLGPPAA